MTKAIILRETGGPEKLLYENIEVGAPGAGEVQIRHSAIGLNFIDVYDRTGLYPLKLPAVLGREAAGVVSAVGPKVRQLAVGMRVAYALSFPGSYCELRNVPAERLVRVPDGVSDEQAAAMMLKGMTVQYLIRRTYKVKPGEMEVRVTMDDPKAFVKPYTRVTHWTFQPDWVLNEYVCLENNRNPVDANGKTLYLLRPNAE